MRLKAGEGDGIFVDVVFVDGVTLRHCVEFDDVEGWADVLDEADRLARSWPVRRVHGVVTFTRRAE